MVIRLIWLTEDRIITVVVVTSGEKGKSCPLKEGCYKDGTKTKTYSVSIKSELHQDQMAFQETEYYKEKAKLRYKIEAKNSELKMSTDMTEQFHTVSLICKCKEQ